MFNNKTVLITGGTGSFGKAAIQFLLRKYKTKKIIIFSRDENKQFEMQKRFKTPQTRFFIGDIRDKERVNIAFSNVDYIIHAAALKHVPAAEYNPMEFIKTNIHGTENVINAAIQQKVKKVLLLSTDKACSPVNLYGATKLCAEKLITNANNMYGSSNNKTLFGAVRYGNVINSRGSVIPIYKELFKKNIKEFPLTSKEMTRFFISLDEATKFVFESFKFLTGGEIFIPKLPTISIFDIIKSFDRKIRAKIIGVRPGEKINETLCSKDESPSLNDCGKFYILYPTYIDTKKRKGKKVPNNFIYNSGTNKKIIGIKKIKEILKRNIVD